MSRSSFFIIIALLIIFGIGLAGMRHYQTGEPWLPGSQQDVWQVEARIDFTASGDPVSVSLALPDESPQFVLFNETAASPGYGFSITSKNHQRRGEWTKRDPSGQQTIYYKAEFVREGNNSERKVDVPEPRDVVWDEPAATAAKQVLASAMTKSSSTQSLLRQLVHTLRDYEQNQNAALLLELGGNRAHVLEALLNQAGVSARVVMGLYLEDARRQQALVPLVRVYDDGDAITVNPETGEFGIPDNLLLWNRDDTGILDVAGGARSNLAFSMIKRSVPARQLAQSKAENSLFGLVGVHLLPIEAQSMFKLLFLLPIGALVVVFMRLVIGVKTSGTFMPILIAMAFLQTSLLPGLAIFIVIVAFGLLLRSYLSYLNLLMVARISTLIVLVIGIIAFMSLVTYKLGITNGITITFFPMIILAWTIERMSILWEEEGPGEVMVQGFGSLAVAVVAYALMRWSTITHLSFNFPELNLVVIAALLVLGQYTGYRLSELRRFRDFVQDDD